MSIPQNSITAANLRQIHTHEIVRLEYKGDKMTRERGLYTITLYKHSAINPFALRKFGITEITLRHLKCIFANFDVGHMLHPAPSQVSPQVIFHMDPP